MAFVYEQKRDLAYLNKKIEGGPGQYQKSDVDMNKVFKVHNNYKCTSSFMQAPRKNRSVEMEKRNKERVPSPGPGHYYIKGNFDQPQQQDFASYVHFQNNSYQFASQSERTEDLVSKTVTPGPGAYEVGAKAQPKRTGHRKEVPSGLRCVQEIIHRQEKVPSIPYAQENQELLGYDLDNSNHVKKIVKTLAPEEQRGPGAYKIKQDDLMHQHKKGVQFSQLRDGRKFKLAKDDKVGPGQYDPGQDIQVYKLKPSVAFSSKSGRFPSESAKDPQQKKLDLLYKVAKLQNMDLVKQRVDLKKLSEEKYEDLVEKVEELVEYVEESVPGPGYYSVKRAFDDMPKGKSTLPQHDHRKPTKQSREGRRLGPGSYDPKRLSRKDFSTHQAAFQSSQPRDKDLEVMNEGPGPGRYDIKGQSMKEQVIDRLAKTKLNNQFGVNQRRFDGNAAIKQQLEEQHLGPGAYNVPEQPRKCLDDQQGYVFKSGQQKLGYLPNEDSMAKACVGQYFLGQGDIKAGQDKVIQQQAYSKRKVPFTTTARRFTPAQPHQSFDDELLKEQMEDEKLKQMKRASQRNKCDSFQSKQPRFNQSQPPPEEGPALQLRPQWVKNTHNVKFKPMFQSRA